MAKQLEEPKAVVSQLTDKDGLGGAYDAANDISVIDSTLYIAGTQIGRASAWSDDITKVPTLWNAVPLIDQYKSFMCGMKAVPCIGDLARKVDAAVPYVSMGLKTVPLLAPENGEAALKLDESVGAVSMG